MDSCTPYFSASRLAVVPPATYSRLIFSQSATRLTSLYIDYTALQNQKGALPHSQKPDFTLAQVLLRLFKYRAYRDRLNEAARNRREAKQKDK